MGNDPPEDLLPDPPAGEHAVGDRLIGVQIDEYRLETLLGSGGMARVYRAVDVNLHRTVAIKVIDTPYRANAEYGKRFKREAQAIAQLEHPHIVRLYRYGQADGLFYMAMQFIRGAHLGDVLHTYREDGAYIEPLEASRIIREVGEALDYAHGMGVIHRDVKSSNIMLDQMGRAVLTDFGLALLSSQGARGDDFGTPHYLSPEQALPSAKIVPQSDLYSLGVVLFEMFTGQRPFSGSDPYALAQKHIHEPPPSPCAIRPEISAAVESVILKALEKDPQNRFQSGHEMAEALQQALFNEPVPHGAAQASIFERVRRKIEQAPAAAHSLWSRTPLVDASPTRTKLSWEEDRRRNPLHAAVFAPGGPAPETAGRRSRNTAVGLAALLFVFLCIATGALAAAGSLPWLAGNGSGFIFGALSPDETSTSTPEGSLPGPRTAQSPGELIPNTGPDPAVTDGTAAVTVWPTFTVAPASSMTLPVIGLPTETITPVRPTATNIYIPPTVTNSPTPPTATVTPAPSTATNTAVPPTETDPPASPTATPPTVSPTAANTPIPMTPTAATASPVETRSPVPPTATPSPATPTVTRTPSPTATNTAIPPTSTSSPATPTLTRTPSPTVTDTDIPPTPTSSPEAPTPTETSFSYQISIQRQGADPGWMVITNTGASGLPLSTFRVASMVGSLGAESWGADTLPRGGCLLSMKEGNQGSGLPDGIACIQTGLTAWVGQDAGGIFQDQIDVFFQGLQVGVCEQAQPSCQFAFR